jgi:hypothetical protein
MISRTQQRREPFLHVTPQSRQWTRVREMLRSQRAKPVGMSLQDFRSPFRAAPQRAENARLLIIGAQEEVRRLRGAKLIERELRPFRHRRFLNGLLPHVSRHAEKLHSECSCVKQNSSGLELHSESYLLVEFQGLRRPVLAIAFQNCLKLFERSGGNVGVKRISIRERFHFVATETDLNKKLFRVTSPLDAIIRMIPATEFESGKRFERGWITIESP